MDAYVKQKVSALNPETTNKTVLQVHSPLQEIVTTKAEQPIKKIKK
jgi:hypothetical protein